ncbi:MAG: heavy metal translocating P-type ATPase [Candidatus Parabeggiatoa sp.]|nr:heavy metal translocating P-type ATPase [Candidatus Parabeggiatoa sp.]
MFLLDGGLLLGAYFCVRLIEKYHKKTRKNKKSFKNQSVSVKPSQPMVLNERNMLSPTEKQFDHYLKLSTVSVGVAAARQFFFPSLSLFNAALYAYIAFPALREAEKSLVQNRKINGYVLDAMLITLALSQGQYFAAAMVIWFFYLGRKILAKTEDHSKKMLTNIFVQQPNSVWMLKEDIEIEIPLSELKVNDIVVVNTGEVVPIDGMITQGMAMIDQHALTGESQPAEKGLGDQVFASTLLLTGKIYVKVEKTGEQTTVAKIGQFLTQAAYFKTKVQSKGEELADKSVKPILGAGLLALPLFGPYGMAAVLYCNFGNVTRVLASLGTLNHLNIAAHKGILVKDGRAIEYLTEVDTVLFDKTGTLTKEEPEVGQVIICDNYGKDEVLKYAAAAECKLAHPIARAILKKANESNIILPDIEDAQYQMGYGMTVTLENQIIRVGSIRFMTLEKIAIPQTLEEAIAHSHSKGHSLVMVAINDRLIGTIEMQSSVRPEAKSIIEGLRQRGIKHISIVSGDHKQPTQSVAEELNLDSYFYDILPEKKAEIVEQLQKEGKTVCFVGDGINDAIALTKANVSISLGGAASIATDMAQVVLMDGSLSHLCELFDLSNSLDANLHRSFFGTVTSGVINLSGIFLLHFGLLSVILIANAATAICVGNAMSPLLKLEKETTGKIKIKD